MARKVYNSRFRLSSQEKTGVDPWVDKYLSSPDDPDRVYVDSLKSSSLRKSFIEAALIATNDYEEISKVLDIPANIVEFYAKIYFDLEGFDKLDRMELVANTKDSTERTLKMWASSVGMDFLIWRLGGKVVLSPIEGLTELFNDCIFKSKEAIFNSNSSEASKESTKWVKLSIDIARLLKIWLVDSAAAMKDLELALRSVSPDFKSMDELD